ncbi:MAG: GNAT family N-acetyltransferase [Pseudomonadales bacterium]|nr:GNAT family N-acetyltransferase [Pseudomonadales bacterium]
MNIEIRSARPRDKARCLELLQALNPSGTQGGGKSAGRAFEELLTRARGEVLVASEETRILGMATVSYNLAMRYGGEYCQLEELIVDSDARGKNIGALLVQKSIDNARSRGCAEFGLYLLESTEHNRPFYAKFGFEAVGTEMRQKLLS